MANNKQVKLFGFYIIKKAFANLGVELWAVCPDRKGSVYVNVLFPIFSVLLNKFYIYFIDFIFFCLF